MGASLDHADASVRARYVERRAATRGIRHLFLAVDDKLAVMGALLAELSLSTDTAAPIGDDLPDLPLMHAGGFSATPRDGHAPVQQHASLTTVRGGAPVAVREACEFNLQTQGKLAAAQAAYRPPVDGQ